LYISKSHDFSSAGEQQEIIPKYGPRNIDCDLNTTYLQTKVSNVESVVCFTERSRSNYLCQDHESKRLKTKTTKAKRTKGVAEVVLHLTGKHEALNLNSSIIKM
jgi:hypothetical protein